MFTDPTFLLLLVINLCFCCFASGVVTKDASAGTNTIEKQNRFKRAAKVDLDTPLVKKIKVSQDVVQKYDKFVTHGRKFKRKKTNDTT